MQIFKGEYLQDREKASCRCTFWVWSICKTEKKQVADALYWVWSICKTEKKQVVDALFGCGVSARQRKSKLRMHILAY